MDKEKNHMVISIDVEKRFDKIQCAFMIQVLERRTIGNTHECNKVTYINEQNKGNQCGKPSGS